MASLSNAALACSSAAEQPRCISRVCWLASHAPWWSSPRPTASCLAIRPTDMWQPSRLY